MQKTAYHIGLSAHLLTGQAGYRSAGINGYIANLLQALPDADPALRYTVFAGPQGHPPAHPRMTVRRSLLSTERPARRIFWEQAIQPWAVRQSKLDLLHDMAFVGPVVSRVPQVVTVYDMSFVRFPAVLTAARRLYLRRLTGLTCQRARRVIAISDSTARDLMVLMGVPAAKIDVAPPGVDPRFRSLMRGEVETFRRRKGLPDRFLLFLGTLEPRKNLPVLLRAYAQLPAKDRAAVHLVLAGGKGWMFDEIDRTIEAHGLSETVHMPGYIPAEELVQWYNAAEALVYPSLFEGFGLPVLEAMACGIPVLVSDVASLPEAAGDAGYRLPPADVNAWADALAHVIADDAWREAAGQRGQARAAEFTWARTAAQTVASYRRALEQGEA